MTAPAPAQRILALVVGLAMAANGMAMLFAGVAWYRAVPGVVETGPFNGHFVEDIGAAYLAAGAALAWLGWRPSPTARGAAGAGTAYLGLHAAIHLTGAVIDPHGLAPFIRDFPGVFAPPLLAGAALWRLSRKVAHA
ncbi:MAG TPA: hypothetical protein VGH15_10430 [Caulobacteraceae bacterium]